jgi:hypothetical protein
MARAGGIRSPRRGAVVVQPEERDQVVHTILALALARGPAGLAREERVIEEIESVGFPESIV